MEYKIEGFYYEKSRTIGKAQCQSQQNFEFQIDFIGVLFCLNTSLRKRRQMFIMLK